MDGRSQVLPTKQLFIENGASYQKTAPVIKMYHIDDYALLLELQDGVEYVFSFTNDEDYNTLFFRTLVVELKDHNQVEYIDRSFLKSVFDH